MVAPIWRDTAQWVDKAAWGALLREREVTGRDAIQILRLLILYCIEI